LSKSGNSQAGWKNCRQTAILRIDVSKVKHSIAVKQRKKPPARASLLEPPGEHSYPPQLPFLYFNYLDAGALALDSGFEPRSPSDACP
jgi:hypothetical protein